MLALILVIIVVLLVIAAGAVVATRQRSRKLHAKYGPEYDRLLEERGSRRDAERELTAREKRHRALELRPLDPRARERFTESWTEVQARFVDAPEEATARAQRLVTIVMRERGYPTENFDQELADLSVEHATTLDHFRAAHGLSERAAGGQASTEELRQALVHYRALFEELLEAERSPDPQGHP
jgi:hypothetical protein